MPPSGQPDPGAIWVGALDTELLETLPGAALVSFDGAIGHRRARLLVRTGTVVRGYAGVDLVGGAASAAELVSAVAELGSAPVESSPRGDDGPPEPISVVVCTRDRPDHLRTALASLRALQDGAFEIIVVDNASATDATRAVVDEIDDPRIRLVEEPIPGLATARNSGIRAARHGIIAFTDDDVLADPLWLRWIRTAFADPGVGCVSGLVPSGELRNDVQRYFDARVNWSKTTRRAVYRTATPPAELPMFPFCVGEFGTGANFALRRDVAIELGGFDRRLGVGTRTKGGEDIDMFVRVLLAGHALVVEPSAVIWHRHRSDVDALRAQAVGYGRGLGAWLTKVALDPRTLAPAMRRAPAAVGRLIRKPMTTVDRGDAPAPAYPGIARTELRSVLSGPPAYLREHLARPRGSAA
ncbi:glycosyltransferase [Homoserinibacter sp. GY 40078]|nr:glycosyltransferase [Homoserinibacter sp. GY 40078]